jgi:hypothetical protein
MNQYNIKAFFFEHFYQFIRTIPAIKGDRKLSEFNTVLLEKLYNLNNHASEDLWFGCVSSTLLAYRSDVYRDYPITYVDSYDNDVLTLYRFRLPEYQLYVRLMTFPSLSITVSSTLIVIFSLERVAGLLEIFSLIATNA